MIFVSACNGNNGGLYTLDGQKCSLGVPEVRGIDTYAGKIYFCSAQAGQVGRYDPNRDKVLLRRELHGDLHGLAINPLRQEVYVIDAEKDLLHSLCMNILEPVREPIKLEGNPVPRNHFNDISLHIFPGKPWKECYLFSSFGGYPQETYENGFIWSPRGGFTRGESIREHLLTSLHQPHSPKWFQGRIWWVDSATGNLCSAAVLEEPHEYQIHYHAVDEYYPRGLLCTEEAIYLGLSKRREGAHVTAKVLEFRGGFEDPIEHPLPSEEVYGIIEVG